MKKLTFIFIPLLATFLVCILANISAADDFLPSGQFDMNSIDTHRKIGITSIVKQKARSKVEFEGNGLKRGKYILYLSRYCQPIEKKKVRSRQQKKQLGIALLNFTTHSGSLWSEQWLRRDDLPLNNSDQAFVFVLVRRDKAGTQIIAKSLCARLNPTNQLGSPVSSGDAVEAIVEARAGSGD